MMDNLTAKLVTADFPPMDLNRRSFLKTAGLTAIAGMGIINAGCANLVKPSSLTPARSNYKRPLSPLAFKKQLSGPILSLPTTFTQDLDVNYPAINKMVDRAFSYGVPVYALTAGNSKYRCLTYQEIKQVTQTMVEAVGGRGLTIAATGIDWPVEQSVDYARFAESIGTDSLQILRPYKFEQVSAGKWQNMDLNEKEDTKDVANLESKTTGIDENEYIVNYFKAVAKETCLPLVYHGRYTNDLLAKLTTIDQLVAIKDDYQLEFYVKGLIEYGDRFEIFSGGEEYRYLVGYPFGARAFFATFTGFAPDIPMKFWQAILDGDIKKASAITKKYDYVFIKNFSHPFWHATLEYFGLAQRYLRKPYETYTDEQMNNVKKLFDEMRIDPQKYA